MLKKRSAYRVLARRASGAHVLNGPIMLHRMAKRVRAAEHHSCQPVASRCGRSTGRALQRPPRPRFASARRVLLTKVGLSHRPARTVACCVGEVRPVAERHAFGHPRPPSRCHPMGGTGRSRRGLARRRTVSTSKALRTRVARTHALVGPVPICFRPARNLALPYSTTCASGAQHAYAAVAEVPVKACSRPVQARAITYDPAGQSRAAGHGCTGLVRLFN